MLSGLLKLLFRVTSLGTGVARFAIVVGAMFASIQWAPPQQSMLLLLASCFVLPGVLSVMNLLTFDVISRSVFSKPYGSDKYRKSVRNSGIFATVVAGLLLYAEFQDVHFVLPQSIRELWM